MTNYSIKYNFKESMSRSERVEKENKCGSVVSSFLGILLKLASVNQTVRL
jgi:hypothetical protein